MGLCDGYLLVYGSCGVECTLYIGYYHRKAICLNTVDLLTSFDVTLCNGCVYCCMRKNYVFPSHSDRVIHFLFGNCFQGLLFLHIDIERSSYTNELTQNMISSSITNTKAFPIYHILTNSSSNINEYLLLLLSP